MLHEQQEARQVASGSARASQPVLGCRTLIVNKHGGCTRPSASTPAPAPGSPHSSLTPQSLPSPPPHHAATHPPLFALTSSFTLASLPNTPAPHPSHPSIHCPTTLSPSPTRPPPAHAAAAQRNLSS
ncbi:vegetative cell wall protein gp1-like [Portunus trituberculatus]|uniref:vegetative cell wall protein gp1-like n=1 Tax=Portunus trituberculatus TaxID=210409 RepID=UPI001E1CB5D5|nr:vegetative cell wall protein gp1-like [Portunus trituberculatus]